MKKRIVGEVSVNWRNSGPSTPQLPLSQRFELIIASNAVRGYELESWQLVRVSHPGSCEGEAIVNETIIAVFVHGGAA